MTSAGGADVVGGRARLDARSTASSTSNYGAYANSLGLTLDICYDVDETGGNPECTWMPCVGRLSN